MSPQPLLGPSTLATKEGGSPDLLAAAPSCLHLQGMEVGREARGTETQKDRDGDRRRTREQDGAQDRPKGRKKREMRQ